MSLAPAGGHTSRLLVVQTRRLGDVLMVTPLLRALARRWPAARIDVLVEPSCAPALSGNPHASAVLDAAGPLVRLAGRLRRARYDVVIDAMGKSTSALLALASRAPARVGFAHARFRWCYTHRVRGESAGRYSALEKLALLSPLGIDDRDCALQLPGDEADRRRAAAWWGSLGLDATPAPIAFAPVSRRAEKQWPAERFARVCDQLVERTGRQALALHGPGEAPQLDAVIAHTRRRDAVVRPPTVLPFASLPEAMRHCAGYLGNDNGIRHVAVGLGLPTLAVFGRPAPVNWTPPDAPRHLSAGGRRDIRSITVDEVAPLVETFARALSEGRTT